MYSSVFSANGKTSVVRITFILNSFSKNFPAFCFLQLFQFNYFLSIISRMSMQYISSLFSQASIRITTQRYITSGRYESVSNITPKNLRTTQLMPPRSSETSVNTRQTSFSHLQRPVILHFVMWLIIPSFLATVSISRMRWELSKFSYGMFTETSRLLPACV
jgi:hypothetical protein